VVDRVYPRILIVRLSAIGDTVLSVPVLCALRDHFAMAKIGWIVEQTSAPLLRGHADLDDLFELPRGWMKSPRMLMETARQLRRFRFDVALDLQGLTKSAILARLYCRWPSTWWIADWNCCGRWALRIPRRISACRGMNRRKRRW
jgi:ADP-heptose:LPS heptosyltransferase